MHNISAIESNVIFQFTEDVTQSRFINSAESGMIVNSGDGNQALWPRWGKAIKIGPDVKEVIEGDYILIESGKWTLGFFIEDVRYWKTDESKIIGVSDEHGYTY